MRMQYDAVFFRRFFCYGGRFFAALRMTIYRMRVNSGINIHLYNLSLIPILSLVIPRHEGSPVVNKVFITTMQKSEVEPHPNPLLQRGNSAQTRRSNILLLMHRDRTMMNKYFIVGVLGLKKKNIYRLASLSEGEG